jgi:hydrogenase maturation factor
MESSNPGGLNGTLVEATHASLMSYEIFSSRVEVEESEELLKQFVQDALLLKSSGSGTTLYDQYVESLCLCVCVVGPMNIIQ